MFFVFEREKKARKKMITGISEFGFFCPKMAVSWRITSFQKKQAETPIFIVFLGARFLGQGVKKRQFLDTLSKKKKILTDNWKALFLVFLCFFLFLSWFFFFFVFFVLFFVLFFFFVFFVLFFFGGFKGQVRWPKGPPHLALNPPYFFVFVFLLFFVCFLFVFFWRV